MKLIICLTYAFGLSEFMLMLVKRSRIKTSKSRSDRGSLILLWIAITFGFTGGFFLSEHGLWNIVNYIFACAGLILVLTGLIIRWTAIMQLGRSFTVDVAITNVTRLKTDGIYKWVRHPSYLGLLLVVTGFAVTMNSIYSFIAVVFPIFLAIGYRILVEERLMFKEFGEKYTTYMKSTKKLIPGIY
jgi:protein-S-isoprenylcysteine O-methyltransferase Ste14